MKTQLIVGIAVLVLCLALGGVYWYVTWDKRAVVNMVQELTDTLQLKSGRPAHEGALKHQKAGGFFAPRVSVRVVDPALSLDIEHEQLVNYFALFFRQAGHLSVEAQDIEAEVAGDEAAFSFDAEISCSFGGDRDMNGVYRINGSAKKIDGNWKISSIVIEPIVK